jgi:hypothetical protein
MATAGESDDLFNVIHKLGDKLERVMLFGHNPELTELTHRLSSKITHMPTCAVAEFHVRCKVVVKHRQGQARKSGPRLSQKLVGQSITSVMKAMLRVSGPLCGQRNGKISLLWIYYSAQIFSVWNSPT